MDSSNDIEALVAADITASKSAEKDTEHTYTISKGEDIILSCDREFSPAYELYTWKILNGTDIVSLDSAVSASCTVHGKNKGAATVQVTYNWGATEPDVLTGIDRTVIICL